MCFSRWSVAANTILQPHSFALKAVRNFFTQNRCIQIHFISFQKTSSYWSEYFCLQLNSKENTFNSLEAKHADVASFRSRNVLEASYSMLALYHISRMYHRRGHLISIFQHFPNSESCTSEHLPSTLFWDYGRTRQWKAGTHARISRHAGIWSCYEKQAPISTTPTNFEHPPIFSATTFIHTSPWVEWWSWKIHIGAQKQ